MSWRMLTDLTLPRDEPLLVWIDGEYYPGYKEDTGQYIPAHFEDIRAWTYADDDEVSKVLHELTAYELDLAQDKLMSEL